MTIYFIDSETRSLADLPSVGAYAYANNPSTDCSVWGYATDDGPGYVWSPAWAWGQNPDNSPTDLLDHVASGGLVVAWNAFFDRHIWNAVMVPRYGWPPLMIEQVLCAQAQAESNLLPGQLAKAAECLGTHHKKDPAGKRLIQQLCIGDRSTWDSAIFETPEKMGHFRSYCIHDVLSMRDIWQHTRPLTQSEWAEYHASEHVNDRGVAVDAEFAFHAMHYANAEIEDVNAGLMAVSGDVRLTVTNHTRKARWLYDQLWPAPELQAMVKRPDKVDKLDDGTERVKERFSADRSTREAILELLSQPEYGDLFDGDRLGNITEFLELIEAGNSAAVRKFSAICNMAHSGRVRGQYSFNGAGQTGRFSSRGIQIHNLINKPVDKKNADRAIDAMEDIINGAAPAQLVAGYGFPVSRLLARLIRPTFIAGEGNTLVWADWDQIEGRCLPWLSDSPGGRSKLKIFADGRDIYRETAAGILNKSVEEITDGERQAYGKVTELALGFGGGVGAFGAMAKNYGVSMEEDLQKRTIDQWRANNSWAVHFWSELWEAAINAYRHPGQWFSVGRVKYLFHPSLMRGTLVCEMPDGRWLVYPQFRREQVKTEDDKGRPVTRTRTSFVKGFGSGHARVDLWYGVLAENITQGIAASFLRRSLVSLRDCAVLHTHDEIVTEVPESAVEDMYQRLEFAMNDLPDWAEGLPLSVTVEHGPFYTK